MAIRTKGTKTAQPTKGTRIEKRELGEAELNQVSGGSIDRYGNIT